MQIHEIVLETWGKSLNCEIKVSLTFNWHEITQSVIQNFNPSMMQILKIVIKYEAKSMAYGKNTLAH